MEAFGLQRSDKTWRRQLCKKCESDRNSKGNVERRLADPEGVRHAQREYYHANKEAASKRAERAHLRKHGVDEAWYHRTLAAQGGGCAMCGTKTPGGPWPKFHIDHDHSCCGPNRSCDKCRRGLLCNRCNLVLGFIENEIWAKQAKVYLNTYRRRNVAEDKHPTLFDELTHGKQTTPKSIEL